jgi:hypothetical protein
MAVKFVIKATFSFNKTEYLQGYQLGSPLFSSTILLAVLIDTYEEAVKAIEGIIPNTKCIMQIEKVFLQD